MSDEEKKAIESFKEENNNDLSRIDDFNSYTQFKVNRDKLIMDLIEKQQKEIEELKQDNGYHLGFIDGGIVKRYEMEDKIKARIKEYKKDGKIINQTMPYCGEYKNHFEIKALQSLLEEE